MYYWSHTVPKQNLYLPLMFPAEQSTNKYPLLWPIPGNDFLNHIESVSDSVLCKLRFSCILSQYKNLLFEGQPLKVKVNLWRSRSNTFNSICIKENSLLFGIIPWWNDMEQDFNIQPILFLFRLILRYFSTDEWVFIISSRDCFPIV